MMFIWKDQRFYGSNAAGLAEMYNDKLKEKKAALSNKHILWKHSSLKDTNKNAISSQTHTAK